MGVNWKQGWLDPVGDTQATFSSCSRCGFLHLGPLRHVHVSVERVQPRQQVVFFLWNAALFAGQLVALSSQLQEGDFLLLLLLFFSFHV